MASLLNRIAAAPTGRSPQRWQQTHSKTHDSAFCCRKMTGGGAGAGSRRVSAAVAAGQEASSAEWAAANKLPKTYKRLVASGTGNSFREVATIKEMPMTPPGPGQALLKMLYAGVNGGCETFRVRGEYAFTGNQGKSDILLGAEGSGLVMAVGPDVTTLKVGDVVACNTAAAFTEYSIASANMCVIINRHWSVTRDAVALTLSALTACAALEVTGGMKAGQTVAITAASGGTGQFAVQLAKLAGCKVVAFCSSNHKAPWLMNLGADVVINYKLENVPVALKEACPAGIDLVYEGVGGQLQKHLIDALAPGGKILQVGYISEYPHTNPLSGSSVDGAGTAAASTGADAGKASGKLPANAELFWGGMNVDLGEGRTIIGQVWPSDVAAIRACKQRVFDLYDQGKLRVLIDNSARFAGLDSVADAIDHMLTGSHVGKVVVKLGSIPGSGIDSLR